MSYSYFDSFIEKKVVIILLKITIKSNPHQKNMKASALVLIVSVIYC